MTAAYPDVAAMGRLSRAGDSEPWRCEWRYPNRNPAWLDNITRTDAELFLQKWQAGDPGGIADCHSCPAGFAPPCSHAAFLYLFTEMTEFRIMPMREAL